MHDLSLYLLELLENSVRAGAKRVDIDLFVDQSTDELRLAVDDDGRGLDALPERVVDPFYSSKPGKKTGLGLSLLRAEAQAAAGDLSVGASPTLGGTRVDAHMQLTHVDRVPLGDVAASIAVAAVTNPGVELTVTLRGDQFDPPLLRASPAAAAGRLAAERVAR
jgi:signal transduction histidine kinase